MGRRKITITRIRDDRNRAVTFLKRKNGLFKKAYELGVLCDAQVAVIVFSGNGRVFEFSSHDMDDVLLRYSNQTGEAYERKTNRDFGGDWVDEGKSGGESGEDELDDRADAETVEDDDGRQVEDVCRDKKRRRSQAQAPPPPPAAGSAKPPAQVPPAAVNGFTPFGFPLPQNNAAHSSNLLSLLNNNLSMLSSLQQSQNSGPRPAAAPAPSDVPRPHLSVSIPPSASTPTTSFNLHHDIFSPINLNTSLFTPTIPGMTPGVNAMDVGHLFDSHFGIRGFSWPVGNNPVTSSTESSTEGTTSTDATSTQGDIKNEKSPR